jgi:hypothetical protein
MYFVVTSLEIVSTMRILLPLENVFFNLAHGGSVTPRTTNRSEIQEVELNNVVVAKCSNL